MTSRPNVLITKGVLLRLESRGVKGVWGSVALLGTQGRAERGTGGHRGVEHCLKNQKEIIVLPDFKRAHS